MSDPFDPDPPPQFVIQAHERLLWSGRPRQGLMFRAEDAYAVPFNMLWLAFAIFWTLGAATASLVFALFGLPFVAIGIHGFIGRFAIDARRRRRTEYGLTDRRVLIRSGKTNTEIRSLPLSTLGDVSVRQHRNSRATITFGAFPSPDGMPASRSPRRGGVVAPAFEQIENGAAVYDQLIQAQYAIQASGLGTPPNPTGSAWSPFGPV